MGRPRSNGSDLRPALVLIPNTRSLLCWAFPILGAMPPGVVAVRRSRRRPFAVLYAVPAWLRALFASRRGGPARSSGATATEHNRRPRLVRDDGGALRCTGCGDCAEVCPARCLEVVGEEGGPVALRLEVTACIGCGRCLEVCAEGALEETGGPALCIPGNGGIVVPLDLLEEQVDRGDRFA